MFSNCYISSQILAREHPERFKRFKQGGFTLQSSPASVPSLSLLTRCPYCMSAAFLQGKGRTTDYIQTIVCIWNFWLLKKKQPLPCKNPWKCPQGPCSHHLRRTVKKIPRRPAQGRMTFCENRNTEYLRTRTTSKWPALVQVKMTVLQ